MIDHLTGWPMAKAIPNKEATTVANAVFEKLILEHSPPSILLSDNGTEFSNDTLAYVCNELGIDHHFTSPYTPRSNGKVENFNKFLKATIRKLCQDDTASWDLVIDQILWIYRCCPHTSTGECPYMLVHAREPNLPLHKLIQIVEPYRGTDPLHKRFEQTRVITTMAAKMLEKMRANQKRHTNNRKTIHQFKVGDLVLLKKHVKEKLQLKWEPNYRIIRLPSAWSAIIESQITGQTKRCNIGDLKAKHPAEDWKLPPGTIGRAAKFVNHPDNLPDIDFVPEQTTTPLTDNNKDHTKHTHNLRKSIKAPAKLDL